MGVARHVVLPAVRLLVWAVIAVALCVLAFGRGGDDAAASDPLSPAADLGGSTHVVQTGDLSSTVRVTGTVSEDAGTTVRSTAAGTVGKVHVTTGSEVAAGARLVDVVVPVEPPPQVAAEPDGTTATQPSRPRTRTVAVTAPAAGRVSSLDVLKDQDVSVGTDLLVVSPGTLSVTAPLTQGEQFRLLTPPATAQAQAPGGPAPFECTDLRTGAAAATTQQPALDPYSGMAQQPPTAQVVCRVPAGTTVFAGMSVELTIDTGAVTGAVVVPVSAVRGTVGQGTVWVVGPDGEQTERSVTLGLTDGRAVQVTEGLAAGETVLEFTPVPLDDDPPGEGSFG